MSIFSFFSGSGFLDLGFENAGFNISFVNEFNDRFLHAYKHARTVMGMEEPEFGYYQGDINDFLVENSPLRNQLIQNIRTVHERQELVGFIGGPPCPDFSIAGRQRGRDGVNGQLSLSYVNLIIQMKPDFFLFENVKGLWSTTKHRLYYDELVGSLHTAGYCTTAKLVNSLAFGAPQDRERILLFGVKRDLLGDFAFEKDIVGFPWNAHQVYDPAVVKARTWADTDTFVEHDDRAMPAGTLEELTVEYWFNRNHVDRHPNANNYFTPRGGLARMQTVAEGDVTRKSYKRLHRWRYSPTAAYGNNEVHLHPYEARRLSAAEALAIQTLPEEFVLPNDMTLSDMFKTIGNGVPYVLARGIADTISDFLNLL